MLLFSKIYEFYCLYGIEILLSGATGASRYCPALPGELHGFLARRSGATVEGSNNPTPLPRVKGKRVGCQLSQCHNSLLSFPTYSAQPNQQLRGGLEQAKLAGVVGSGKTKAPLTP